MNYKNWIASKVFSGEEATISLALLEKNIPDELPSLRVVQGWVDGVCKALGCKATIHVGSDVVTFYPRGEK
jgi:hypothetical protein